ncbi:hypothetical protein HN709_02450 [Candidatus Peregrinibacteria bacterium]|nr:hypothetical protein [Candidatus Peregrinibacteria bacterium]
MKLVKSFLGIFRAYTYGDKLVTGISVSVILLMIVKMIVFPYGLFGFGDSNIYTEGVISRVGIQNINPVFVQYNEADREVSRLVFSGLMKYDPEKRAVVDDIANLELNEEKTVYTFTLREGIKWHDGEDLTVDDVFFTYNDIIMDPSFPNEILKTNFSGVNVEVIDESTIKFTLAKPNIFFSTNFTTGILPMHILEGVDPAELVQDGFNKVPIGSGPYMLVDSVERFGDGRQQVTLERSPLYYGQVSEIEKVRLITYPTMEQLVEDLGTVNGVTKVTGEYISDFKNNDRFDLFQYELPQYTAVFCNMDAPILKENEDVRLSLQKAIDKGEIVNMFEDKVRVDTPLMELNQEEWEYQVNVDEANGLLKESGFNYPAEDTEKQGIRYDDDGIALELNLIARLYEEGTDLYSETTKVVDYLQTAWESIGFSIQVEFLPEDVFRDRISKRSYDLLLVGQSLGYNLDTYSYWHSTQANPMGQNLSNYKSFGVDTLIEDIRFLFNQDRREDALKELAENLKEDVPAIFLYRPVYFYASDGKVSGISMEGVTFSSDRFAGIGMWKFER